MSNQNDAVHTDEQNDTQMTIEGILQHAGLDIELRKFLLEKLFEERRVDREMALKVQDAAATRSLAKRQFFHNTPLVLALVGMITIGANGISAWWLNEQNSENTAALKLLDTSATEKLNLLGSQILEAGRSADAKRQAEQDERAFAFKVVEQELAKSVEFKERAGVLLFLVRAGILKGLNQEALEKMALDDLKGDGSKVSIPPTLGVGATSYNLPLPPVDPAQTAEGAQLLASAVAEINKNLNEVSSWSDVLRYWSAIPNFSDPSPNTPWNATFLSWLIQASGNPDKLTMSPSSAVIWASARSQGIIIDMAKSQPLPGDIAFYAPSEDVAVSMRTGPVTFKSLSVGVVYRVTDAEVEVSSGNGRNSVGIFKREIKDPRLLGFGRLGTSKKD